MKDIGRTLLLSAWISGIVLAFGCGDDTSSPPLAPSPSAVADHGQRATVKPSPPAVADRGQQATVNHDPAAAWNDGVGGPASASSVDRATVGLKSTAPEPRSPIGDAEIDDQTPVLTASKATSVYGTADFEHEFALFKITGGNRAEIERGRGTSQGAGVTSYQVRKRLDLASSYSWRVRAVFDDEHGPWSADAGFRTTAVILGTPRPLSPSNGEAVGIRPVFRVRNGTVEGNAGTVSIQVQVAADGDFADVVARAQARAASGEDTEVRLGDDLMPEKTYFWRARAMSSAGRRSGSWSAAATFRTVAVRLGTPRPLSPINDATTTTIRPVFRVRNGAVEGHAGVADIRLEVASDAGFMQVVGRTRKAAQAGGETDLQLSNALRRATRYYWRVRALLASPEVTSGWSATQRFRTPDTTAFTSGGSPNAPFTTGGGNPRNMIGVVRDVARRHPRAFRNSCQDRGGSWEFMDRVVEELRKIDGRWGYNCKRGNCNTVSHDVVNYYRGSRTSTAAANNSPDVSIIDVIANHCNPNPQPAWTDLTRATRDAGAIGRWKYPRR